MAKASKPTFSPDPARFIMDQNLSALDIRVLAAIAIHDRFSANGVGCTAGHGRLAAMVGCHLKSLSRSIRTLAERGYIGGRSNPLNPRSRCYFVIYNDQDEMAFKAAGIGNRTVTHDEPTGNQIVPQTGPIGNQLSEKLEQDQEVGEYNIFSEAVRNPVETVLRNSVETASSENSKSGNGIAVEPSQGLRRKEPSAAVGAMLAMCERGLKSGLAQERLRWWFDYLEQQVGDRGELEYGTAEYGRAFRLYEQIGEMLDNAEDAA